MNESDMTYLSTTATHGRLSNLSPDFPLFINSQRIASTEHLYQALKFPDNPELQQKILRAPSPGSARQLARRRAHASLTRSDWASIRDEVMAFCLRAKLLWHWVAFGDLLRATVGTTVYEISNRRTSRDLYWGVVVTASGYEGENRLGAVLMTLRDELIGPCNAHLRTLSPPDHLHLRLLAEPIRPIDRTLHLRRAGTRTTSAVASLRPAFVHT